MKFLRECYIELACSKDETRMALMNPYFKDGCIFATDGRILAMIEVEWEPKDKEGYVPKALIKDTRAATKKGEFIEIDLSDEKYATAQTKSGMMTTDRNPDCWTFPKCEAVIPKKRVYDARVVMDPFIMLNLSKALGTTAADADTQGVEFYLDWRDFNDGPVLTPTIIVGPQGFGMQMPMRVSEKGQLKRRRAITSPPYKRAKVQRKKKVPV